MNNAETKPKELFEVNPTLFTDQTGYTAIIDGAEIKVVPNKVDDKLYKGDRAILEPGYVMFKGTKTESGKLEDLSKEQIRQLAIAQVIIFTPEQQEKYNSIIL